MTQLPRQSILLMCFLSSSDPIYESFSTLGHNLRERGIELVLCASEDGLAMYDGFTVVDMRTSLRNEAMRLRNAVSATGSPLTGATLRELAILEQDWHGAASSAEIEVAIQKVAAFWGQALDILAPCAVLVWGTTVPQSRLMLRLSQAIDLPVYTIERGWLEDTLTVGAMGQGPLNDAITNIAYVGRGQADAFPEEQWRRIADYYSGTVTRRYSDWNLPIGSDRLEAASERSTQKVLFLGSFDLGGGFGLRGYRSSDRCATWIDNSRDAGNRVAAALAIIGQEQALELWYKPHPANPFDLDCETIAGHPVIAFDNADVHQLIQAADILVTVGSGSQFLGFIYEKPVVSLGNSFLMGRGATYAVDREDDLDPVLREALNRDDFTERLARGRAAICSIYRHNCIALNDQVPCERSMADFARDLSRLADPRGALDWPTRMAAFKDAQAFATGETSHEALKREITRLKVAIRDRAAVGADRRTGSV